METERREGEEPAVRWPTDLLTAWVAMSLLSQHLTRLATTLLGPRTTSNRHVQMLTIVDQTPGITPSQVADVLQIQRSAASRLLRRLEHEGLVRRCADPADRRVFRLHATARGREKLNAFTEALDRHVAASSGTYRQISQTLAEVSSGPSGEAALPGNSGEGAATILARAGAAFMGDLEPPLPELGVTLTTDRAALSLIRKKGAVRPSALAEALGLGSSGTAGVVGRLVRAGLVERRADPADGRAALVCCTPRGARVVDTLLEHLQRHAVTLSDALRRAVDAAPSVPQSGGLGAAQAS